MSDSIRALITTESPVIAPSIYDGISARLVGSMGFRAAYVGSYAAGATLHGLPDIGFIGVQDVAELIRRIAPVAGVPLIVDGEGGFGNPLHAANTVKVLERAGASAIHIEDHVFGKHLGTQTVLPLAQAVDKISAAVDAKQNTETMIIARTDSILSEGIDAAIDRLLAYQEAGADALFAGSALMQESIAPRLVAEAKVPIFAVNDSAHSAAELAEGGAAVVMFFGLAHFTAYRALRAAYQSLKAGNTILDLSHDLPGLEEFDDFLGIDGFRDAARMYHLIP